LSLYWRRFSACELVWAATLTEEAFLLVRHRFERIIRAFIVVVALMSSLQLSTSLLRVHAVKLIIALSFPRASDMTNAHYDFGSKPHDAAMQWPRHVSDQPMMERDGITVHKAGMCRVATMLSILLRTENMLQCAGKNHF